MPLINNGVVLHARVGTLPGGFGDLLPQVAGLDGLMNLTIGAADQVPIAIGQDLFKEIVGQTDRVVGVLARNGQISVGIPVGIIGTDIDLGIALLGEFDDAVDIVIGDQGGARGADGTGQTLI